MIVFECPNCDEKLFSLQVRIDGTIYATCVECKARFNMTRKIRVS